MIAFQDDIIDIDDTILSLYTSSVVFFLTVTTNPNVESYTMPDDILKESDKGNKREKKQPKFLHERGRLYSVKLKRRIQKLTDQFL